MSFSTFRVLPRPRPQADVEKNRRLSQKWLTIAFFVVPGMAVFLIFLLIPVAQSAYYSLYKWYGFGALSPENYIGLGNYDQLLNHKIFQGAVTHSLVLMALSLMIQLPLALGLALLVGRGELPGRRIFRTILFVPYVFSEVITAIIWLYVLHPNAGLVNNVLTTLIPGFQQVTWLADRSIALYSIFAVITWKYFGFHMILYMAGLQAIPVDLEEAARIDGAKEAQVLRYITLPLLGNTIRLSVFLSVLGSLQQFVLIWILTEGGPVNATETIGTYLYKFGLQRFNLGYGTAVAVVLFMMTLLFSLGYQRFVMRQDYEKA
jgi:raffinose/stachyose/melibiose transport system permease protein